MTYEENKKLQKQEFKFLDSKDLAPLLHKGKTITDIADAISRLYDDEYTEEDFVLNVIDNYELAEYLENKYGVKFIERTELVLSGDLITKKESLKRRIKFISGAREYSYVEDFTEYIDELINSNNEYSDTHEKITKSNYHRYIEPCKVKASEIGKFNGIHVVYGMFEAFSQSYGGCIWLSDCNENDELFIVFENYTE